MLVHDFGSVSTFILGLELRVGARRTKTVMPGDTDVTPAVHLRYSVVTLDVNLKSLV